MQFNSLPFLIFFPIVVLMYYLVPKKAQRIWLLVSSYFFYMCWNPKYIILMVLSTLITYSCALLISRKKKLQKLWLIVCLVLNIAILAFFKYSGFLLNEVRRVLSFVNIQVVDVAFDLVLPIGISFYIFQALGYTIDVYRGKVPAEKSLLTYALFVSFFPQLVAGPIERSGNLLCQMQISHKFDPDRAAYGLKRMLWGFFLKIVIADRVALLVNEVFDNYLLYSGSQMLLAAILFSLQIYCDFGGYSNIAIGAAEVMGFKLMDNFRQPYFSLTIKDFWSRWHISLSTWFRDYLYIPLGGNRKGKLKKYRNLMITFLVSGLWHGASWHFVAWGGFHGLFQIAGDATMNFRTKFNEKLGINTKSFGFRLLQAIITFVLVDFAWIFFRADGIRAALIIIKKILFEFDLSLFAGSALFKLGMSQRDFVFLLLALAILVIYSISNEKHGDALKRLSSKPIFLKWAVYWLILILVLLSTDLSGQEFVYFQF